MNAVQWMTSKAVAAEYSETGLKIFNGTLPAGMANDARRWFETNGQYRDCGNSVSYSAHVGGFAYTLRYKVWRSQRNTVTFTVEPIGEDPDQQEIVSWWAD